MQISRHDGDGRTALAMRGEFTIYAAAEVHAALAGALDAARDIEIDLSGVSEIDSSALQILRAAGREAGQRGLAFEVTGHPPVLTEALQLLRLSPDRGDCGREEAWT